LTQPALPFFSIDRFKHRHHMAGMPQRIAFITPAAPVLKREPPVGPQWVHEVIFDGWRMQLHKVGDRVVVFSRNGIDMTSRFGMIRDKVLSLPADSAIIDAELVACDSDGKPDFQALMNGERENLCAWCFDLLELDGRDMRLLPLVKRKAALRELLIEADDDALRYSDEFDDPAKLLAVVTRMGLEGIVSKLGHQPYRSGKNVGWVKVKSQAWREANRERWEMFQSK
jgi:bifunctional non-homologous end joining protein LigD